MGDLSPFNNPTVELPPVPPPGNATRILSKGPPPAELTEKIKQPPARSAGWCAKPQKQPTKRAIQFGRPKTVVSTANDLSEFFEGRNFNEIRDYLHSCNPPKSSRRKHLMDAIFTPRSGKKASMEVKQIIGAGGILRSNQQTTLHGHKYGQILLRDDQNLDCTYDTGVGASTIQVNRFRDSTASTESNGPNKYIIPFRKSSQRKELPNGSATEDLDDQKPRSQNPGLNAGITDRSSHRVNVNQDHPSKRFLTGLQCRKAQNMSRPEARDINILSPPVLPPQNSSEYHLGSDIPHLFPDNVNVMGKSTSPHKARRGSSQASLPIARSIGQHHRKDFAPNSDPSRLPLVRAMRSRSRSPVKKMETEKKVVRVSHNTPSVTPSNHQPNGCRSAKAHETGFIPIELAASPIQKTLAENGILPLQEVITSAKGTTQDQGTPPSPKSPTSTVEDAQSDASIPITAEAESKAFFRYPRTPAYYNPTTSRNPPQPGPAPTAPLPSLPEAQDAYGPSTPENSESSQRVTNPEDSPVKVPPKSPARYRLTPSNPNKGPASPARTNVVSELRQVISHPGSLVRINTAPDLGLGFPVPPPGSPPSSPVKNKRQAIAVAPPEQSSLGIIVATLDQWKDERVIKTSNRKLRDLERIRSQKAELVHFEEDARAGAREEGDEYHEGVVELPSPVTLHAHHPSLANQLNKSSMMPNASHQAQPSFASVHSGRTTLQSRDSILSPNLSPIISLAEQKPTSPIAVQRTHSQSPHASIPSIDAYSATAGSQAYRSLLFQPAPPIVSYPDSPTLTTHRPKSSQSLPTIPHNRPVAGRIPTPFTPALLRAPANKSPRSSLAAEEGLEERLEARIAGVEKKNGLLEAAFLAVVNASARLGEGNRESFGSEGVSERECAGFEGRRSGSLRGEEGLLAELESLLVRHGTGRGSFCSGP